MAVESAKWRHALEVLGFATFTVAGSGPVDVTVDGLAIGAASGPTRRDVARALDDADLVVVENLCSLPLNPRAWRHLADSTATPSEPPRRKERRAARGMASP